MLKYLRIAVTALCLTACMLLMALWVRSYSWTDFLFRPGSEARLHYLQSHCGMVAAYSEAVLPAERSWTFYSHPSNESKGMLGHAKWGFAYDSQADFSRIVAPHWLFVLCTAVLGVAPWIHFSKRFSLRTLLIVTTLVAVGLGLIVVLR